ncbi:MAG: sodium:solute symporter family protein [Acidobacteria bacterium]|nr:sodium:solute symporter family protein [Acidobacteriota bacterium]
MNSFPAEVRELVLSNYQLIIAALVGYFAIFLLISIAAKRRLAEEAGDYIVASRNLGWLVVTFTMFASVFSGVGMAGLPGSVYTLGAPFVVSMLAGNSVAAMLMWYLGPRIWVLGKHYEFTTPGDLLGEYYQSDTIRLYTVFASLLYNLAYIVAQLLAGGILLNVLTGNTLSPGLGSAIIAVIVVVHVVSSGLRGIAWLDLFNGFLILAMLVVYGLSILSAAGGPGGVLEGLGAIRDRFITIPGLQGVYTPSYIYGIAIGLSLGSVVLSPSMWIRMYEALRKAYFAKISVLMLLLWALAFVFGTYLIGSYGRTVFAEVESPEFLSSLLAFKVMPAFFATLFLVAVLAAIISTTDTYMHTLAATVVRDLVRAVMWKEMDSSREVRLNRIIIIVVAALGLLLALSNPVSITRLAIFAGAITIQLLTPLLGAVTWSRASTEAALIAPATGIFLTLAWELKIVPYPFPAHILPSLATAFFINVFLFVVVSLLTRPQSPDQVEKFHGLLAREL